MPTKNPRSMDSTFNPDIPHINFGSVFLRPPCDEQSKTISPPTKEQVLFLVFRLKRPSDSWSIQVFLSKSDKRKHLSSHLTRNTWR